MPSSSENEVDSDRASFPTIHFQLHPIFAIHIASFSSTSAICLVSAISALSTIS